MESMQVGVVEHALVGQVLRHEIPPSGKQERDFASHLEEQVVPGSPWPTEGNDEDLLCLVLPDLYQCPL